MGHAHVVSEWRDGIHVPPAGRPQLEEPGLGAVSLSQLLERGHCFVVRPNGGLLWWLSLWGDTFTTGCLGASAV